MDINSHKSSNAAQRNLWLWWFSINMLSIGIVYISFNLHEVHESLSWLRSTSKQLGQSCSVRSSFVWACSKAIKPEKLYNHLLMFRKETSWRLRKSEIYINLVTRAQHFSTSKCIDISACGGCETRSGVFPYAMEMPKIAACCSMALGKGKAATANTLTSNYKSQHQLIAQQPRKLQNAIVQIRKRFFFDLISSPVHGRRRASQNAANISITTSLRHRRSNVN